MWVTGPLFFRPANWLGSLVGWFVRLLRRRWRERARRPASGKRKHDADPRRRREDVRDRAGRRLAVTAVISSEARTVTANGPTEVDEALSLLHDMRGPLVVDLTATPSAPLEQCTKIAISWPSAPAPSTPHTRLAILLRFEHWALIRTLLWSELALLATKGVETLLAYQEQCWEEWFVAGEIVHDAASVLHTLRALVEHPPNGGALPLSHWRIVLATAASLLEGLPPEARAEAFSELTCIALECGANAEALDFANEAGQVADKGSVLECRALRLVGVAMMRQGLRSGAQALEDALQMAISIGATDEAAAALNELALRNGLAQTLPS